MLLNSRGRDELLGVISQFLYGDALGGTSRLTEIGSVTIDQCSNQSTTQSVLN